MKKLSIIILTTIAMAFSACEESFEDINSNPNQPESVSPDLLLSQVIHSATNEIALSSWNRGNIVAQYTAKINFTAASQSFLTASTSAPGASGIRFSARRSFNI